MPFLLPKRQIALMICQAAVTSGLRATNIGKQDSAETKQFAQGAGEHTEARCSISVPVGREKIWDALGTSQLPHAGCTTQRH